MRYRLIISIDPVSLMAHEIDINADGFEIYEGRAYFYRNGEEVIDNPIITARPTATRVSGWGVPTTAPVTTGDMYFHRETRQEIRTTRRNIAVYSQWIAVEEAPDVGDEEDDI